MKITTHMLSRFIDVPDHLYETTNQSIIEVESYEKVVDATNLVIGHVLTCEKHENADTLSVTTVDVGDEILQIVCGAPNVAKGQYVIVSKVGAILPGGFEIKQAKIRGVASQGMICSLNELGFEEKYIPERYQGGIFYYLEEVQVGADPLEALGMEGYVIELGLTPNRSDLLSTYGYAKDLSAMLDRPFKAPDIHILKQTKPNPIKVKTETEANPLYHAAYVEDIVIKPSPWWLKSALIANGIKPINNVVDISNYVMLEYGTPLHMFDRDKVETDQIVVRMAKSGEKVITLDEDEHTLASSDIVITNGKEVIAIGGVMGCLNTMIDDQTKHVIIEAAYFDPKHIQKTSRRLSLRSDSSLRFERGVDPNLVEIGLYRAMELLIALADAKVYDGISKDQRDIPTNPEITIDLDEINQALDIELTQAQLSNYLKRYGYDINQNNHQFTVTAPSYRNDIIIKADVIEEIARIHGLNNIPTKRHAVMQKGGLTQKQKRIRKIQDHFSGKGLQEVINYALISLDELNHFDTYGAPIHILSPISEDRKYLRQSLIGGLLGTLRYNQSRQMEDVAVFEMGKVFAKDNERLHLGVAITGKLYASAWKNAFIDTDLYVVKGLLDGLVGPLGISLDYQSTQAHAYLHPYQQADIIFNDQVIGHIGRIHPKTEKRYDIDPTYVLEIDLDALLMVQVETTYDQVSKFPSITRDLAILIDETIDAKTLLELIGQTGRPYLKSLDIFDVYQGDKIEQGKRSIAFRLIFNDKEKTLTTDDVDKIMKKITNRLGFTFQAIIRS